MPSSRYSRKSTALNFSAKLWYGICTISDFSAKALSSGIVSGRREDDIELLAETGTAVTHHPSCNLRVRNGISPAFHMLQAGVLVGLGLDGKSINDDDDMIQEMKICYLLHRLPSLELESPHMKARQVFRMATENNAILLGFESQLGRLEPGRLADMALIDYTAMAHPYVDPSHDPIDTLLYRGAGRFVHTVLVNGRVVVEAGRVLTIDEDSRRQPSGRGGCASKVREGRGHGPGDGHLESPRQDLL